MDADDGDRVKIDIGHGRTAYASAGSLAELALVAASKEEAGTYSLKPMGWSIGLLGDLLWRYVPESREALAEKYREELENAIYANRELSRVSTREIASECFWGALLQPAFESFPDSRKALVRYLHVLRIGWTVVNYPGDMGETKDALHKYVFEWIAPNETYIGALRGVDPDLYRILYSNGRGWYAGE